jgi:hypothetical protein
VTFTLAALVLGLAIQAAATPRSAGPVRPVPPPGLSWQEADAMSTTVARIERRVRSGRPASKETLVVTEGRLNSYVNLTLASRIPSGVSGLEIRFERDGIAARALIDLDRVKRLLPEGGGLGLLSFLGGTVPVELKGRLPAREGTGRVEVEEALVGGVSLPSSVLAQVVALATRSGQRPQGIDILSPFDLPYSARSVRLEPGRALVDFYQ